MPIIQHEVRAGAYYDSIILMQLQSNLMKLDGVVDVGVVMATEANRELLAASELLPEGLQAGADDLVIVVQGESETAVSAALAQVDPLLTQRRAEATAAFRPKSLRTAVRQLPAADWVLISVPGRYAARVAHDALDAGKHVFLYSDNVSLEDEIGLKQKSREKGLLVMGPDCGTAIVNGVGLGFANRVRRGDIGIVGASGTGIQAITSQIHNMGGGISHAIGTGGRDLKGKVGGITALQGLELLAQDDETAVIVLISKPPETAVANKLLAAARATGKQAIINFLGYPPPAHHLNNLYFTSSLAETASLAISLEREPTPAPPLPRTQGYLRALFSGGTLAYEALLTLSATLSPIHANLSLPNVTLLSDSFRSQGHTVVDMGEDEFTQGRLHPMMDNGLRLRRLAQETADPDVGLILLDVVLGEGAHPDPAGELAPAIAAAKSERDLTVAALVVGTDDDPQDRSSQIEKLQAAGTIVFTDPTSAFEAVSWALFEPGTLATPNNSPLNKPLAAINVGLEMFHDSVVSQDGTAVHVEWRPPASGNEQMMALLAKMRR
ncbi:MAG: acyl-CoA synthetase FdrA [Chloroflexota bacterium]